MPPRRRKTRPHATRCAFTDRGRRCPSDAIANNGGFCRPHRLVMEEASQPKSALGDVISDFFTGKKVSPQRAAEAAADVLSAFFTGAAAAGAGPQRRAPGGFSGFPFQFSNPPIPGGPRAAPRPPPPPDDELVKRLRARKLLGFTADEVLTVEAIRKRQRELAKRFHPDKHPPDKRERASKQMATISGACALLMDDLR